jgi:multisubunit Na+/H+ antiporter MnhB subunit
LIIKYSDYFFYGIIWIAIIIWAIIIIRDDKPLLTKPINKTLRLGFIIVFIIGLCSQIAGYLLLSNIPNTLEEYLNKHNIMYKDFYPVFQAGSGFGNLLICITLIVLFFILTRDYNKSTNANTAYKQWRKIDSI